MTIDWFLTTITTITRKMYMLPPWLWGYMPPSAAKHFCGSAEGHHQKSGDSGERKPEEVHLAPLSVFCKFAHPLKRYFVVFYLAHLGVAIECYLPYWHDHEWDAERDRWISEQYGVRIVRFTLAELQTEGFTSRLAEISPHTTKEVA